MTRQFPDIPHDMQKVYRRFERWRSAHMGRLPIPARLWAAAVEVAREHGVSPTTQALRLEYGKLKRLLARRYLDHRLTPPAFSTLRVSKSNAGPSMHAGTSSPLRRMRHA